MNNEIESVLLVMKNGDRIPFELSEETKQEIMEKMSKLEKWKPKKSEYYFYLDSTGEVDKAIWHNDGVDIWRYRNNMVFKTEADARKYKKVFEAICEVSEEHPVDWKDEEQKKYYIKWSSCHKESDCTYTYGSMISNVKYASYSDFIAKVLEKGISEADLAWFEMR